MEKLIGNIPDKKTKHDMQMQALAWITKLLKNS